MATRKPTSLDIAYMAGVSQATVSRALRGSELVSKATRERIVKIAKQLNYRTDRNAASLRSQRTKTLALLLFEEPEQGDSHINPFFLSMLGTITRAASREGYDLLVSFQRMDQDWHTEYEISSRADGILLLGYGAFGEYGEKLQSLIDANAHFVIWGPVLGDGSGRYLCSDNRGGGREAVAHLLGLGRQRIAFVGNVGADCPEFAERFEGYKAALAEAGIAFDPALQIDCESQELAGRAAIEALYQREPSIDAVFTASDAMAIGVAQGLSHMGVKIPADVSVVGFDDIPAAQYFNPALTTVHQDTRHAGRRMVRNLIQLIEGEAADPAPIQTHLVVRESCGSANSETSS